MAGTGLWLALLPIADRSAASTGELEHVDRRVAEIEALLTTAHFRSALGVARATRQEIETLAPHPDLGSLRARLEVLSATAEVALGRRSDARQSLTRALEADPSLALDERTASPKLLELLPAARRQTGIAEPTP